MRGLKSTLALVVVLAGLGAYIYFAKPHESTGPTQEKVFAGLETDKIDELKVQPETGDPSTLKKTNGVWEIVTPAPGKASDAEVTSLTGALGTLEISRVLEENATDLKEYGLDKPRIQVEFKSADGKNSGVLQIGAKTAAGGNIYVKRGDQPRVLVVGGFNESSFTKSAYDLRDKALMAFDRSAVTSIEVDVDGKVIQLDKLAGTEPTWKLVRPIISRADTSMAEGILASIESGQMKSIASTDANPADLKKFGLDRPSVSVALKLGSAQATLAVGGKAGEDDVYVRDISKPIIMTAPKTLADDLKKSAEEYRLKELFEFRAFSATRLDLTRDGKTVSFERVKGKDDGADTWKRVAPTAADADKEKIEGLLTGLADIRAQSFVSSRAGTGLDSPALTVVAKFDEGKREEKVTFGRGGKDVYAATVDPGVAKIEAGRLDEALKSLDELSK